MVKKIKIYKNFSVLKKYKKAIILIGNFDGVHIGHQKLFKIAQKFKKKYKLKTGVVNFNPMPKMYFFKKIKNFKITNLNQKNNLFRKLNVDFVITKKFDKKFSKIKSDFFIKNILFKKLNPKFIFVSNNFKFGNKREGDVNQLISCEKLYDYKIIKPHPLKRDQKVISSSLIRELLSNGNLSKANKFLGRNWAVEGIVEKGRQQGKKIGFPTCNLSMKDYIIAKPGVYKVKIREKNKKRIFKGIANLGYRPTFNQKKLLLEVHIFNFSGNLYNKYLSVEFIKFIRKEKKFRNVNELKKQIKDDLKIARQY